MAVQEFECQLARGQIGRYLGGETLSSDLLRQLGAHVSECNECREFLDKKRNSLKGLLAAEQGPAPQAVEQAVKPPKQEPLASAVVGGSAATLISKLREKTTDVVEERKPQPQPPTAGAVTPKKTIFTKPLMLCGALALVLIGMSYVSHNPTSLFGPKAAVAETTKADATATAPVVAPKASTAPPPTSAPAPKPITTLTTPAVAPTTTPTASTETTTDANNATVDTTAPTTKVPVQTPPAIKRTPKANTTTAPAPKPRAQKLAANPLKPARPVARRKRVLRRRGRRIPHARIRVYDASGHLIP